MKPARHFALPILAAVILSVSVSRPALAQFGGGGMDQMQQFAPMLEMMKKKRGKKRFGQIMQMVGPMMSGEGGGLGNIAGMIGGGSGGFNAGAITSMIGGQNFGGQAIGDFGAHDLGGQDFGGIGEMIGNENHPDPAQSAQ
jgi:hypothetical protein